MKKLILFFLLTTLNIYPQNSSIQEEINLNSFKYIIIEKLESNSLNWSSLGLSDFIEKTLEKRINGKRKYTVVSLKESRPKDLMDNPSLGLYIYGNLSRSNSVSLEFYDHNLSLLKTSNSNKRGFHSSVLSALTFMTNYNYEFDSELVTEKPKVFKDNLNKIDITNEVTIREYLDRNNSEGIEGIWEFRGVNNYKLLLLKKDYKYLATVIERTGVFSPGDEKAEFEQAAVDGVFTVKWIGSRKTFSEKTIATLDNKAIMKLFISNKESYMYKIYPPINRSKNKKSKTGEWAGNGSGIIISKSGYIVTNYHVIDDADEIEVEFILNGELQKLNAEIVQVDKVNDLAILRIFDMNFDGLDDLPYNFQSRSSDVGTTVYAYGYPMALTAMGKEIKVTDGIINSKSGFQGDITTYQISAPIQGGNSGGPLFDDQGNFIGINSAVIRKDIADNVGYTIKSSYVLSLIDVLPKSIELPSSTELKSLPLTEQIKQISKFVVLIKTK